MTDSNPLTREQVAALTQRSNLRGGWILCCQFAITAGIFALAAYFPNPLVWLLCLIMLGGRHMGFFVLTHEAGHGTLFASPAANKWVSKWLTSPMDFSNGQAYMREHLEHHRSVGLENDPDLANYADYPVDKARFRRKLMRDITGRTGWRNLRLKLGGFASWSSLTEEDRGALMRGALWHTALLSVLTLFGYPFLYLLWLGAQIFTYPLIARVRQISEHAAVPKLDSEQPILNTRTTMVDPLTRLVMAPHGVNYHVEHHLVASIPIYRLSQAHSMLKASGYYDQHPPTRSYRQMLRGAVQAA